MRTNVFRSILLAVLVLSALSLPLSTAAAAPIDTPPEVTPAAAACGRSPSSDLDTVKELVRDAANTSARQRTGSSTSCTARGQLEPSDDADYWCYTWATGTESWTFLTNLRTGVRGWVRDDLLDDNGSARHCGF
jgi:hypothetical protein